MSTRFCVLLAFLFSLSSIPSSRGQSSASVWDGVYTAGQAGVGKAEYQANCASCHGDKLQGRGQTPPLIDSDFTSRWDGMTLGELFDKMQSSMPADRPGQLKPEQNAAILAYLLEQNHFPAGSQTLPSDADTLKPIRFIEKRPAK